MGVVLEQNLGQIRSIQCCEKSKEKLALSIGFFPYFHGEYLFKHKVVVVQIPEWKFKANIARIATFEGCLGPNFWLILVKNCNNLIIFKAFTLVSQS